MVEIKVIKHMTNAIIPKKAHDSDIGYDITCIDIYKKLNNRITLYETGIQVKPPSGYYIEIVPRSSICKTGYMLANSIGIIDPDYTGTLKIALMKICDDKDDLKLPFTKCQLILRKSIDSNCLVESKLPSRTSIQPNSSFRGNNGFGSTDSSRYRLTYDKIYYNT